MGKSAFEVLELVEATSSSKKKIEILMANATNELLAKMLRATFDYKKRYYIKQLPEPTDLVIDDTELPSLTDILITAEQSGREADFKQYVADWLSNLPDLHAKWYRRVILRDLRCGVNVETAVKAGFEIPVFEVQLATDSKKCKKLNEIITKGVLVSPKLDGYRCLAVGVDGVFTLYTRNGNVYENFPIIKAELELCFPRGSYVFDGEIMSDSFNAMQQSAFASVRGTTVGDVRYHIFDMIPHDEWFSGEFRVAYFTRYERLKIAMAMIPSELLQVVLHTYEDRLESIRDLQHEFEAAGFEGAMANPNIAYYMGRKSNALLKFKDTKTQDCRVIEMLVGKGKYADRMGVLRVVQENGKECEVGSGFTDEQRADFWGAVVLGRVAEIKFQELTDAGVMRFPIFVRWRDQGASKI